MAFAASSETLLTLSGQSAAQRRRSAHVHAPAGGDFDSPRDSMIVRANLKVL